MRTNKFGDRYCNGTAEVRSVLDDHENGWDVYATQFDPPEGKSLATVEIRENVSGDLVCYVEAKNVDELKRIISELKIEIS